MGEPDQSKADSSALVRFQYGPCLVANSLFRVVRDGDGYQLGWAADSPASKSGAIFCGSFCIKLLPVRLNGFGSINDSIQNLNRFKGHVDFRTDPVGSVIF